MLKRKNNGKHKYLQRTRSLKIYICIRRKTKQIKQYQKLDIKKINSKKNDNSTVKEKHKNRYSGGFA